MNYVGTEFEKEGRLDVSIFHHEKINDMKRKPSSEQTFISISSFHYQLSIRKANNYKKQNKFSL